VLARLHEAGVGAGIHYPTPIHLTPAYAHLGFSAGAFPVAEQAASEILSLPLYPHLTFEQQEYVAAVLRSTVRHSEGA
jgi:dTDP-4-amino-4,6-dideoxygalactose transaminase